MVVFFRDKSLKIAVLIVASILTNSSFANTTSAADTTTDAPKVVSTKKTVKLSTQTPPADQDISFLTSLQPRYASMFLQLGAFGSSQGNQQGVRIRGLIGDYFNVQSHYAQNVLLGFGYYINGYQSNLVSVLYGLNLFVFPSTTVKGNIVQEQLFTNLGYKYNITNVPLYLGVKALLNTGSNRYNITLDVGAGANTIHTSSFKETSLDGSANIPDQSSFSGETSIAPTVNIGIGVKFNNVYRNIPLEINYRFFYLGQSNFNTVNNQITSTLRTGNSYANALFFTFKL